MIFFKYWLIEAVAFPYNESLSRATIFKQNIAWLLEELALIALFDFCKFFSPCFKILIASFVFDTGIYVRP
jgi:hypothetical protein